MHPNFDDFITGAAGLALGLLLGVILAAKLTSNSMETTAVHYNYGTYDAEGNFKWKAQAEQENFLKDLDFFKRNEDKFKQMSPNIMPLPKTEDLFN